MTIKIKATKVRGKELREGDLFSTAGPDYWDFFPHLGSIGERVYVRTGQGYENAADALSWVYKIEILAESQPEQSTPIPALMAG